MLEIFIHSFHSNFCRNQMLNQTAVTEFILQGFSDDRDFQILHFVLFFSLYLVTMVGNTLIIITVAQSNNLHNPMYFFLAVLSSVDFCFISTTVPKSMVSSLMNDNVISFAGCITQVFLVVSCATAETFLLTIMACDRYVAICHPLQYKLIMNWNVCLHITIIALVCGVITGVGHAANTFRLDFCSSNIVEQYFCDIPQLLRLSCTTTETNENITFGLVLSVGSFCFMFVSISYCFIFSTVFKIKSTQGQYKVFSTCIPHLTVFCLFVCTVMFSYMRPKALSSPSLDLLAAVLYTILPPLMNPIIYSLRNTEIKMSLCKMGKKYFRFHILT
ncbi:olfactory receptor 14C36-like [Python bivittatus]|uniref:Olfactory receptor n=1 Tax=Python bivittatus TaxID=176946 RepID=A0A9F5J8K3_PYTBI|nr:olfactory receptor 14C36-like [Python bivittatus]